MPPTWRATTASARSRSASAALAPVASRPFVPWRLLVWKCAPSATSRRFRTMAAVRPSAEGCSFVLATGHQPLATEFSDRDEGTPSCKPIAELDEEKINGSLYRTCLPPLPPRRHEAFSQGRQVFQREVPGGEAQLRARPARQRSQGQSRRLRIAVAREAESQAHLLHTGKAVPQLF